LLVLQTLLGQGKRLRFLCQDETRVEPLSGWHFEREYPQLDSEHFQSFLDQLSPALGADIAVIQMDRSQAHRALALNWPENVIPLLQPAASPELNPIERLWLLIKRQIQGETFATLAAL
jgi:hypothetical protein